MADQDNVTLTITADVLDALKSMKNFEQQTAQSVQKIEGNFSSMSKNVVSSLKTMALAAAAAFSFGAIVSFLKDSVEAAAESESAINALNTAMQLTGIYSEQASKDMQDFASEIQKTTTYEDDAVIKSAALLQQIAGLSKDGLKEATRAAIGMSAALGIDLDTAVRLVGKAAVGNTAAFSRYGIEIKKGTSDSETFANTLKALAVFQGAAEAQTNTYAGAQTQAANAFGDLKEEIGKVITQNPAVVNGIKEQAASWRRLSEYISENSGVISEFITAGLMTMKDLMADVVIIVGTVGKAFAWMTARVVEVAAAVAAFISGLIKIPAYFKAISVPLKALGIDLDKGSEAAYSYAEGYRELAKNIDDAGTSFEDASFGIADSLKTTNELSSSLANSSKVLKKTGRDMSEMSDEAKKAFASMKKDAESFEATLLKASSSELENVQINLAEQQKKIKKFLDEKVISYQKANELLAMVNEIAAKKQNEIAQKAADESAKDFEKLTKDVLEFSKTAQKTAQSEIEDVQRNQELILKSVKESLDKGNTTREKAAEFRQVINQAAADKEVEIARKAAEKAAAESKAAIEAAGSNPIKFLVDKLEIPVGDISQALGSQIAAAVGGLSKILNGRQGAIDLFSAGGAALADAFLPGLGQAIGPLIAQLARGGEENAKMVREFVAAVPDIVLAIADSMPQIIEALIDSLISGGGLVRIARALVKASFIAMRDLQFGGAMFRGFYDAAVKSDIGQQWGLRTREALQDLGTKWVEQFTGGALYAADQMIYKFQSAFGLIGANLGAAFQAMFAPLFTQLAAFSVQFSASLLATFTQIGPMLSNSLDTVLQSFVKSLTSFRWPTFTWPTFTWPLYREFRWPTMPPFSWPKLPTFYTPDWVNRLINFLDGFRIKIEIPGGGGGGGGGGFIQQAASALGFAEGGLVPQGYNNDTFPARLTSGELIIPKDLVGRLEGFLNKPQADVSSAGPDINTALLSKIVTLLSQPMTVATTAEVSGTALADIILRLSRNNARLTA